MNPDVSNDQKIIKIIVGRKILILVVKGRLRIYKKIIKTVC